MLHIIWMILRIVLLVIVCALGILIIALCAVLFWPIRYRIQAEKLEEIRADIRVSWLLHAVSLKAGYKDAPYLILRILGIPVYDLQKKKEKPEQEKSKQKKAKKEKSKKEKFKKEKSENTSVQKQTIRLNTDDINGDLPKQDAADTETSLEDIMTDSVTKDSAAAESDVSPEEIQESGLAEKFTEKIKAFFAAIRHFFTALWQKLKNIQYTIQGFCDRIKGMAEKAAYYKEIFESKQMKRAFVQVKKQLFGILKHIRPRKLSVRLRAGFADPYTTGQVLAAYSVCYPWIWEYVTLTPDFEQEILEGELDCQGRLLLIRFIIAAWKLYFDKNIKYLIKLFKTGGSKNDGE